MQIPTVPNFPVQAACDFSRPSRPGVVVVGPDRLGDLVLVARVGAGLVVGQLGPRRLQLVEDLRDGDDEAVARQQRRGPLDRAGDLKDLRKQEQARVAPARHGAVDVGPHGPGGRVQFVRL
jgi:hypothetical protein